MTKKKPLRPATTPARFLCRAEVLAVVGVSFPTLWKWMREGKFPLSRVLGPNKIGWIEQEVAEWMESRPTRKYKPLSAKELAHA